LYEWFSWTITERRGRYDVILATLSFEGENVETSEAAKTVSDQTLASRINIKIVIIEEDKMEQR
jgi:hypothetical protein